MDQSIVIELSALNKKITTLEGLVQELQENQKNAIDEAIKDAGEKICASLKKISFRHDKAE